ncbi:hypothetical protein [Stigmatella aurantiaca]|uniref:Uncharacterized protein n=1 Tax=Stigmatella aurantiaca (strain DW4/3-1) TaxID=378806 RepID=Q08ZN8_STIAD|nr:hypothetical protein [Stigmatella aurantiaca]ADO68238.1 uncharacterized protein STAUR_0429 [Stigmatella aurantiaca DW4/3-1]EAU65952.1 hypothetical protein STIAU_1782 [Stigmatella aurantiaca DW4/3-1]
MRADPATSCRRTIVGLLPMGLMGVGLLMLLPAVGQAAPGSQGGGEASAADLNLLKIGMELTAVFLFGVSRLAVGLKEMASEQAKNLLGRLTRNRFAGVLTGATATALLDSSSVVIVLGVLLFIGFVPLVARGLTLLVPDRREERKTQGLPVERHA